MVVVLQFATKAEHYDPERRSSRHVPAPAASGASACGTEYEGEVTDEVCWPGYANITESVRDRAIDALRELGMFRMQVCNNAFECVTFTFAR